MALQTFITGSMALSMTDMVKHLLRVSLDKLATAGKLNGTIDEAMAMLDAVEVKEPVLEQAHLWWTGQVIDENCKAICRAEGRMLQCPLKSSGGDYCKKCARQVSTKGKLSFGTVQERLECEPAEYPGVKPYELYAKRHNITDEQITQAEEYYGSTCPRTKRGRPQKSKKASAVDELTLDHEQDPLAVAYKAYNEVLAIIHSEQVDLHEEVKKSEEVNEKSDEPKKEKKPRAKKDKSDSDSDEPKKEKKTRAKKSDEPKEVKEKKPRAKKADSEEKPKEKPSTPRIEAPKVDTEDSGDELEVSEWTHPNGTKYLKSEDNKLYKEDGTEIGTWDPEQQEII